MSSGVQMKDEVLAPILVYDAEYVYLPDACDFTGMSADTIRRWCRKYLIARPSKGNAPLKIHKPALSMLMHGDQKALESLRLGMYSDWRVGRYYDFAGVPLPSSSCPDEHAQAGTTSFDPTIHLKRSLDFEQVEPITVDPLGYVTGIGMGKMR